MENVMKELTISGAGIPLFLGHGVSQTLSLIAAATQLHKMANGQLVNLSPSQFRKYRSTICAEGPFPEGLMLGKEVTIDCTCELSYPTVDGTPQRPVVAGSSHVEDDYTFYRPRLTMLVTDFHVEEMVDELGTAQSWSLELEEI
jgi:hypothetical protein